MYREPSPRRPCPRCDGGLAAEELTPPASALACRDCGGVWLDKVGMAELAHARPEILILAHRLSVAGTRGSSPATCPQCQRRLRPRRRGPITAHRCARHGLWLDGGDLERAFYETLRPRRRIGGVLVDLLELLFFPL